LQHRRENQYNIRSLDQDSAQLSPAAEKWFNTPFRPTPGSHGIFTDIQFVATQHSGTTPGAYWRGANTFFIQ
jgi:hypothetical protein